MPFPASHVDAALVPRVREQVEKRGGRYPSPTAPLPNSQMYSLTVRDHIMIAHSFRGEIFGPAQGVHGATFVVDLELRRKTLDPDGLVVDIGLLSETLGSTLARLNYKNLDDEPEHEGKNTTTEYLARWIFDAVAGAIADGKLGENARALDSMKVSLHESHVAWGAYEAPLPSPAS